MTDLRVCARKIVGGRNCGRCEKCVRIILNFRVAGLPIPPAFARDVTDDEIAELCSGTLWASKGLWSQPKRPGEVGRAG